MSKNKKVSPSHKKGRDNKRDDYVYDDDDDDLFGGEDDEDIFGDFGDYGDYDGMGDFDGVFDDWDDVDPAGDYAAYKQQNRRRGAHEGKADKWAEFSGANVGWEFLEDGRFSRTLEEGWNPIRKEVKDTD